MNIQETVRQINRELTRFHASINVVTCGTCLGIQMNVNGKNQELFVGEEETVLTYLKGFYMATFKAGQVVDMLLQEGISVSWEVDK